MKGVLHCGGETVSDFADYYAAMPDGEKPAVYMAFINLREDWGLDHQSAVAAIAADLARYPDTLSVQLGLSMVSGTHGAPFDADVAAGALDGEIGALLDALETLARPVYLRIGYEFNGVAWNGYQPDSYRAAYQRIAQAVRRRPLEIALVWDASAAGDQNTAAYYPGDDVVDWWGINVFSPAELSAPFTLDFLAQATAHGKPVMIGESSAKDVGTLQGQASWDAWFAPYFALIHAHPEIEMFCYINTNWANYPDFPEWASWGNTRVQENQTLLSHYGQELADLRYLHAVPESTARARFGMSDNQPPAAIEGLKFDAAASELTWNCSSPDVAAYLIARDGTLIGRTRAPRYRELGLKAGTASPIDVAAIDWAGNRSPASSSLTFTAPNPLSKLQNGDFEQGLAGWTLLQQQGASASLSVTGTGADKAAHVSIATATGTNWHLQFTQSVDLHAGYGYTLNFRARADISTSLDAMLQQEAAPYATFAAQTITLTSEWQDYELHGIGADARTRVTFMLGAAAVTSVNFDDIVLWESAP